MITEQVVGIAGKIHDMHRTAKHLFGANYEADIEPYKKVLTLVAKTTDGNEVKAVLKVVKQSQDDGAFTDMMLMCLCAAAWDLCNEKKKVLPV